MGRCPRLVWVAPLEQVVWVPPLPGRWFIMVLDRWLTPPANFC
ncbi:MAG: hypothetical protein DVB22_002779 [Verrucomicrobia bacterium]|nr:MAG: hypothetical protein DVB22_002779 [Verrucomicrobiota bacterium]